MQAWHLVFLLIAVPFFAKLTLNIARNATEEKAKSALLQSALNLSQASSPLEKTDLSSNDFMIAWQLSNERGTALAQGETTPFAAMQTEKDSSPAAQKTPQGMALQMSLPDKNHLSLSVSQDQIDTQSRRYASKILIFILLFGSIAVPSGWLNAAWSLLPLKKMTTDAIRISEGAFEKRIDVSRTRHGLKQLAQVINQGYSRLHDALERQKQFIADASHELRTPLATIISESQYAIRKPRKAQDYHERFEVCHQSAQTMKTLLDSLIELARFDTGTIPLKIENADLSKIVTSACQLTESAAREKQITINVEAPTIYARVDPPKMKQVFINLIQNAIQYTRTQGEVFIRLYASQGVAVFEIKDTGAGISPENQARIFDRFYRVDEAREHSHGNLGLGLAIVQSIVEAHGGEVKVSSVLDEGSTFWVRLPES